MKLTRKQLRILISEIAVTLSDDEMDAGRKHIDDEGGAAGPQSLAMAIAAAEEGDADASEEDIIAAFLDGDETMKQHNPGKDIIDTKGIQAEAVFVDDTDGTLAERKKRKKKKKKKTKSKKRGYLYPYVYGHHDHDFHDYEYGVGDGGFDGGGDGGGGE